ncbi:toprim domain-containing protein, partial [Prevotella nigrescens]|uniref:toprim domain-containing protein n=1 Tax=Prevotella nigrescens TaxID=28133 RepID=UPI0005904834
VLFQNMKRTYNAIGFANDALGWEIRNMYFKGCVAPKAVTTIKRGAGRLQIFEGFMDFLSWKTLNPSSKSDAIVLNSLALLPRIQEQIMGYQEVEGFLDNDDAGRKSFAVLKQMLPQIVDGAARYRKHKDLNEWLVAQSQLKCKQPLLPTTKRGIRR